MKTGKEQLPQAWQCNGQMPAPIDHIAVLITSFNRRQLTTKALASLSKQGGVDDVRFSVFLVDDGCTDGTSEAVRLEFPEVRILQGDGSLFWNGGMRMAFAAALEGSFDAYLFLNDDVTLYDDALSRIIACARAWLAQGNPAIVVGSMRSPRTGECSYGGLAKLSRGLGMTFQGVVPHAFASLRCDTMNGNCALIPKAIAESVGNIEARFCHQFGDLDYGLRAKDAGFDVVIAPGYAGECLPNSRRGTWRDSTIAFTKRWKILMSPKGVPFKEWLLFTSRHYGWRWIYYAVSPYLTTIATSLRTQRSRQETR